MTRRHRWSTRICGLMLLGGLTGILACDSSSRSSPSSPPPVGIQFTPAGGGSGASVQLLQNPATTTERLVLDVQASQVADLFGYNLEISYPHTVVRFDSSEEGNFLGGNGRFDTSLLVAERTPGLLIIGHSRLRDVRGAEGSGRLLSLHFLPVVDGSGDVAVRDAEAVGQRARPNGSISFFGGSLVVDR